MLTVNCYEDNRDTQISPMQSLLWPFQSDKHKKCTEPEIKLDFIYSRLLVDNFH